MIACPTVNGTPYGYKAILNLSLKNVHEGGEFDPLTGSYLRGSDCKLMVLFGLVSIALIVIYLLLWNANVASSWKADNDRKIGKKPTTFKEDLKELLDGKFHALMLSPLQRPGHEQPQHEPVPLERRAELRLGLHRRGLSGHGDP